jgi:uncharacterized protein (TIGR00375 family)
MQIADFHIHSKYSRATSKNMDIIELAKYAKVKGIDILGTGDFSHPLWLRELKSKLADEGNGIYSYDNTSFVLTGEIALVYSQGGRGRRIHYLLHAPSFAVVDQINEFLDKKGRRDYDGRPIFGFTSIELVDALMAISRDIEIVPAHAWTPWFGIFGSMSGFDSLQECFAEKTKFIHSIETGMSSDPAMNWRLSVLDNITLVSNSDSHSHYPWRLGREANVFDLNRVSYDAIIDAIRTRKNFSYTIETSPNYGKYHFDGHANCEFSCAPNESKRLNGLCPKCGKPLVLGVLYRVEQLADRPDGFTPKNIIPFKSMIPLSEVIAALHGTDVFTKKVWEIYNRLIDRFQNEYNILLNVQKSDLEKTVDEKLATLIMKNREGLLKVIPGYDGVYGKVVVSDQKTGLSRFL